MASMFASLLLIAGSAVTAISHNDLHHIRSSNASFTGCGQACSALTQKLGNKVILLDATSNTTAYTSAQNEFWSLQESTITPACFVQPTSAADVASALLVAKQYQCPFAVKSGGHTPFSGAANIENGITIDLVKLNQVTVNNDSTVSVGPGNRWQNVYATLLPHKLQVVGGRVGTVGVGGLTLGGGISYLSGLYGLACDNVRNYEVVLADGCVKNVNCESYPDLYWALRGGGNNFGIVTRFDMDSYSTGGGMWGGSMYYAASEEDALVQAYYDYATTPDPDPKASSWLVLGHIAGEFILMTEPIYTDPVAFPKALQKITSIANISALVGFTNMSAVTSQIDQPDGARTRFGTASFKPDKDLIHYAMQRWREVFKPHFASLTTPTINFQIITKPMLSHMKKRGGNALGLAEDDGPVLMVSYNPVWKNATVDESATAAARQFLDDVVAYAKARNLSRSYVYLNYAEPWANVFEGYGAENKAKLLAVSEKYDPDGVFRHLQPGGIKLSA